MTDIPPADPFDPAKLPFGKLAGDNKFRLKLCPTCRKPPSEPTHEYRLSHGQTPAGSYFLFRDELSAKEYYISAMCQACQDRVFGVNEELTIDLPPVEVIGLPDDLE